MFNTFSGYYMIPYVFFFYSFDVFYNVENSTNIEKLLSEYQMKFKSNEIVSVTCTKYNRFRSYSEMLTLQALNQQYSLKS